MNWVKDFYTQSRQRWGASGILDHHRERANSIERFCGSGSKSILELGAGAGGAAAALAELGHDVIAIELAVPPVIQESHRVLREQIEHGTLNFIEGDFYDAEFDHKFDVVGYWNGFGIGTDDDQRRLLKRIATNWLKADGFLLLDVSNPWPWFKVAGTQKTVETDEDGICIQQNSFDTIGSRFIDSWWPEGKPERESSQSIRCYTPHDFLLLIEGTGLIAEHFEVDTQPVKLDSADPDTNTKFGDSWDYHVKLVLES